jgi:predicted aspartyl protease
VIGTFLVNSNSATVLFDSGASHSFIAYTFIKKHGIPVCVMKKPMLVNSPGGEMKANGICLAASLIIRGVEFQANLIVIDSYGIDVILGMD